MSVKFRSPLELSAHRAIAHSNVAQTLEVTVAAKTAAHPEFGNGSANGYIIDGVEGAYLEFTPGNTYKFDQSDSSNTGHPLRFYEDAAKTTAYTTGVTTAGTPGSAGAYTQIIPTTSTNPILYYQCSAHSLMGSYAKFGTGSQGDTYTLSASQDGDNVDILLDAGSGTDSTVQLTAGNNITLTRSSAQEIEIASSGGGGGGGGGTELSIERNVFTATANQTAFTISSAITASSNTQVYIDGVYQAKSNYTTSGSTITFSTGVPAGSEVEVIHFISVLSKVYTDTFTGNGTTVDFTASKDVTDENVTQVYIDGVYQSKDNYTTSGTTITFSTAPPSGSAIEVVHFTPATYSTLNSNQFTGTGSQTDFTLTQAVEENKSFVFIQGTYQEKSTYSISGTTLTFTTAPQSGYTVEVITVGEVSMLPDTIDIDNFSGTGSQVDFVLTSTPSTENAIDVYINGLYQQKDTFSLSGNTLTFSTAPPNSSTIEVKHQFVASVKGEVTLTAGTGISVTKNSSNNFTISGLNWQTTPKTTDFTATAGEGYFVNTTSSAITVTLPISPTAGDEINLVDYAGAANTNNITITSSDNIKGASDDVKIDYERGGVSMVYVDATQGWIAYNAANETATALEPDVILLDYLVVAGGGGGGKNKSGGGGAGGYRNSYNNETSGGNSSSESSLILQVATNYAVTVGAGGSGSNTNDVKGTNGGNSVFSTITSNGGGGGGTYLNNQTGSDGGSGGGAAGGDGIGSGGQPVGGSATSSPVQGFDGGDGYIVGGGGSGGGGGGASAVGQDGYSGGTIGKGGNGGDGLASLITGTSVLRAGGGGGSSHQNVSHIASGGAGGGGNGHYNSTASSGVANTGGGGGGGIGGGDGGSGIVILRYPNTYTVTIGSGLTGTTATDGSSKVTTFTAGTGNISFS